MVLEISFCIILGFLLLVKGGDLLVDGAVALAKRAKVSKMAIGITVMGFGTSAPELLVSTQAALMGSSGLAVGNVVGSNIANIALILGITSLIYPITASRTTIWRDTTFMVFAVAILVLTGLSGNILRWHGAVMFLLLLAFVNYQIISSHKKEKKLAAERATEAEEPIMPLWKSVATILFAFAILAIGSKLLVVYASKMALGIGSTIGVAQNEMERIIGVTVVAIGAALPELFASVMAARKHHADMAIGNVLGSITFNIMSVIGIASMISPINNTREGFEFDYLAMLFLAISLWVFMAMSKQLNRWHGILLTAIYALYIIKNTIFIL